jgi:hypothetical protein
MEQVALGLIKTRILKPKQVDKDGDIVLILAYENKMEVAIKLIYTGL